MLSILLGSYINKHFQEVNKNMAYKSFWVDKKYIAKTYIYSYTGREDR